MVTIPYEHIVDAHKLDADGKVSLFELTPSIGTGTLRFSDAHTETWLGHEYTGVPLGIEGETFTSQGTAPQATMVVGQEDIDLSQFKPLIWSGGLDNARIVRYKILVDDLLNNRDIKETTVFRVKRVEGYSTTKITLILSMFSVSGPSSLPFRQYVPPNFPFVVL